MFATIELQKQAAADRYHHQLHPKSWAKSPEEAALAVALFRRFRPKLGSILEGFFPSRGLWSMSGWCRGYWSSQGRVEKGRNWVAECNNIGERYTRKNVLFLRGGESTTFPRMFSSSADEVFKISMFAYLARRPANRLRIGRNVCDN